MRFVYEWGRNKPAKLDTYHDPDSMVFYGFTYRPAEWALDTEYLESTVDDTLGDLVIPTTNTGFYYEATSAGVSAGTEPTWPTVDKGTVDDGTVEWTAHAYDLFMGYEDTFTTSVWAADDTNITIDEDGKLGGEAFARVSTVPSTLTTFTLTNTATITRSDSKVETIDRSMIVKVADK